MIFEKVIEVVAAVERASLQNLISLDQSSQKRLIDTFQRGLQLSLEKNVPNVVWRSSHALSQERRDEVDVFGTFSSGNNAGAIIIELDKWRADQVAKKFVSRFALTLERPLMYIALCYGGTESMNKGECKKYFNYCRLICESFTRSNSTAPKQFYGHILG